MPNDITWIGEGTLYGPPYVIGGCEITCGTKQTWKIGITPPLITENKTKKEIYKQIQPLKNQIVIQHIGKDSSGGTCIGGFHKEDEPSHKFIAIMRHTYKGKRIINDSEMIVVGGDSIFIPITSAGNYNFVFKTMEWGENCIKPKNKGRFNFYVYPQESEDKEDDSQVIILTDDEEETMIEDNKRYLKYGIVLFMAAGVILTVANINTKD